MRILRLNLAIIAMTLLIQVATASLAFAESLPLIHRGETLKVMSLNVAHGRKKSFNQMFVSTVRTRKNLLDIAAFIQRERVDVVALQEADGPSRWSGKFNHVEFLADASHLPSYLLSQHAQSWLYHYGTALLSKLEFSEQLTHTFAPSPPTTNKGFTLGQIEWQADTSQQLLQKVDIISVHLDFSRKAVRAQQVEEISKMLDQRAHPVIIMGDFNSDWLADDQVVQALAAQGKLHTYLPMAEDMGTYPRSGRRLDWILVSEELEFTEYRVLPDVLSDHLAVMAEVRLK